MRDKDAAANDTDVAVRSADTSGTLYRRICHDGGGGGGMMPVAVVLLLLLTVVMVGNPGGGFCNCESLSADAAVAQHCASDLSCQNGGACVNGTCVCREGWQGDECQFCGGKVRLTDKRGYISDGAGNYSVGVKCSWLIDARIRRPVPGDGNASLANSIASAAPTTSASSSIMHIPSSSTSSASVTTAKSLLSPAVIRQPSIRLHLEEFATECGWDHLYVYDGDSVDSPLLAVFSGLMYRQNLSIRRVPEVVAHSGSVLLHFFSDDAYNMSGFNISYEVNGCPTSEARRNCSGHGVCVDGTCTCDADFMGAACNQPKCMGNCSFALDQGECDRQAHRCSCRPGFAGTDCTQPTSSGYWSTITPAFLPPRGSASHGSAVWRDTLHIIGGESYGQAQLLYTYDFNGNVWETVHSRGTGAQRSLIPEPRFGASTVMYGDKIVMYGGVINRYHHAAAAASASAAAANGNVRRPWSTYHSRRHVGIDGACDEVWAFDVSARTWENITVIRPLSEANCNHTHQMCGPLRSAGHTATLVPTWDEATGLPTTQTMYAIFGHSPVYGFLNTVQEYSFATREWRILSTVGFPVKGGYGHSASFDALTQRIYVYGGIVSENENAQTISGRVYAFEPRRRLWTLLTAAPSVRFLHTGTFVSAGLMMVFGGNTHNDTAHSFGAKCYSADLLVYDVLCDSWHVAHMPDDLRADVARFGHSAAMFERSLYVFGGFNGQMLSDMLKYTPGDCGVQRKSETCLRARPGLKCVWDIAASRCRAVEEIGGGMGAAGERAASVWRAARDADVYQVCSDRSRHSLTQQLLFDVERCGELTDCQSCAATAFGCTWCTATATCTKDKCRADVQQQQSAADALATAAVQPPAQVTSWESCAADVKPMCGQLHACQACVATAGQCFWDYELSRCRVSIPIPPYTSSSATSTSSASSSAGGAFVPSVNRSMVASTTIFDVEQHPCPPPCSALQTCANCTADECIWCQNEQRCVDKNAYTVTFPYGQCREWTTQAAKCRSAPARPPGAVAPPVGEGIGRRRSVQCAYYRSCGQCRDDPACGWCDDGSETGLGVCLPGGDGGAFVEEPLRLDEDDAIAVGDAGTASGLVLDLEQLAEGQLECPASRWYFTHCPSCQCNGHSVCEPDGRTCRQPCGNLTQGPNCERCRPGWWGSPVNGGVCQRCECNGQATHCNHETAKCYCNTKGLAGDRCEKCDATNHYHGDPSKGSCYYDLTIDYQFTFNLSKKEDRHFTQINFRNSPGKADIDADFTISCSVPAKMNVTVRTAGGPEKPMFSNINCSNFRYRFAKTEHRFGIVENVTSTTFYVYVYDFQPPLWIQIAFSQYPKLNLQQFFITFSTCFLLLLLVAAILWKVKQRYDQYRRRQRLYVEMEQMASRPFSKVLVDIESRDVEDALLASSVDSVSNVAKKRKKTSPSTLSDPTSPIALEPCHGGRAAVLSLLVRLPTGGLQYSPPGQAAGLAVASALVSLGTPPSIDSFQKEPKAKRKQSQHPDSCI